MGATARFGFPLLAAGQAQKELVHNETVQGLDIVAAAAVEEPPRTSPPASPTVGATFIVGPAATGVWASHDQSLAAYTEGGWRFVAPRAGLLAYVISTATWALFRAGAWEFGIVRGDQVVIGGRQVVGAQAAAVPAPAGGTTVDVEARATIGLMLSALRAHGLIAS